MTTPLPDPAISLYNVKYDVRRKCNKCGSTNWLDIEEGFIVCEDCNNREEVQMSKERRGLIGRWCDRHNHKMALIRTLMSTVAAIASVAVLVKVW